MLYNHRQFRKNSDKKIMRKVKKNWIVLSVASFALIGASAVIESNQNISFASETQIATNTNNNQNNNNSTIDNQKKDAKNHLDAEATRVKDDINNDGSLSQSDKDSQNAEVDSYKIAGEQSIYSATDSNSINQALSDSENNIDSSHVKGQTSNNQNNVNDSNADSSSDNQNSQSTIDNQSLQSSAESMSSGASLVSSASSSNESDDGLSLRDGSSDVPPDSDAYISGPQGATGKPYKNAIANTKLTYNTANGVSYDSTTNKYVINFQFGSEKMSSNGAERVLEFELNLSPNLSSKVSKVTVANDDGTKDLNKNNGSYYIKYKTGKVVGGNIDISVYVDPIKVTPGDWISAFMSNHRENSRGELINFSTQIAFSSRRSLTYDQFGNDFNSKLLAQLQGKFLNDLNQTSPLSQTTQLKNNYVSKINAVTTNDDFVNVLNSIKNEYKADNSSLSNAISQLKSQAATSTNNVSNLGNLPANDKQTANNSINSALQTAKSKVMGVSQSSDIAGASSDGINSIKKIELQATINSAINDINNAVANTTNKIKSDITLSKENADKQLKSVSEHKTSYTGLIQSSNDLSKISGLRDNAVNQINSDYKSGPSLSTQKQTAKDSLDNEANKIKAKIDADNTLNNDEKNRQNSNVDSIKAAAQSQIDSATNADGVNNAQSQGISSIDNVYQTSSTSLSDQKSNAKFQLNSKADEVKQRIDDDNTLTSAEKNSQKANVDSVNATDQGKIDAATNADDIITAYHKGLQDIDNQYIPGKTSLADQKTNARADLDTQAAKIKNDIANDATLTQDQKNDQMNHLAADKATAEQAIDNAVDADGINQALKDGNTKTSGDYKPGNSTNDQKTAKKAELDAEANKIKAAIDADNTLTQSQKDAQKANVDADVADSKKAIDNASDAEGIKQVIDSSNAKIDGEHQSGKSIDDQKANAKSTLDAEANKTKAAIDADNTLTSAEKQQQKNNVDQVNQAAKDKIDAASSADEINDLVSRNSQSIDAQHQPGKSVSDQKTAAKNQLDAEAKKIKDAIDADQTLSQSEKNAQKSAVDADVVSGKQAIDNSSDADSINKAIGDTNDKVGVEHVSGKPLSDQKTNAKSKLDSYAESIKNAIDNDATLTQSEKDAQKDKVDDDVKAGKQGIDNANDADSINKLVSDTNDKVKDEHQPGTSVDDQKTNAKKQLDDQADKVKNDIQNDPTLTQTEKNNQMAKVDSDVTAGKQTIDNSSDADSINKVVSDANDKVSADHVSGTSLDNQKTAANAKLDAEANSTKAAIDADNTLTSVEKTTQKAKVDSDVANGKQNIEKATDADSINKLVNDTKEQVDAQHVPGQSLDAQKQAAKQVAEDRAKQTKAAIDADNTLTSAEKTAQKNKVDSENATAQDKIDSATNADDINSLSDRMIGDISQSYVPGTSLDAQKQAAKDKLSQHVQDLINQIFGDDTLTQAEKDAQKDKVDNDKAAAEKSIDAASDADNINQALSDARPKLDADYIPGASLSDQKNDAKAKLDETAAKVKNAIANDATLTQTEKNNQIDKVDSDVAAGKQAIDNAKNSDSINKAVDDTSAQVSDDHKSADSIDTQKTNAKNQLTAKADKIKQDIENDATLTQAEKESQKAKIEDDVKSGNQAIDNASDADSINKARSDSDSQVSSEHKTADSLDVQKENAKSAIDEAAKNTKAAIVADNTLTSAEKESQKVKVDENATASKQAIDNAPNADNINSSVSVGKIDVNDVHKSADSIDTQKNAAKSQLDANAAKIKQDIANDDTLTQTEKDAQTKQVDADKATAEQAIDNAVDADGINQALKDGNTKTSGDHKPGNSTNDQKAAAKKKLDAEAEKIKNAIDNDVTLNSNEKAQQKQNVDSQNQAAKDKIDASTNADDINSSSNQGVSNIDEQHKSSDVSLSQQKENAKSQLDAQVAKVKNDIANDATLTQSEKDAQMAQVDADKATAEQSIDNAPDADSINKAISNGNAKIDADHVSGQSVADQKTSAKDAINNEANKVKNDIANDATLTQTQKDAQMAQVDADKAAAEQAIDNAPDADSINKAISNGNAKIDADHVSGQSVDDQKTSAKDAINDEANKVKAAIDADKTLSKTEKQRQKDNVDRAKNDAQQALDGTTNADDIKSVFLQHVSIIDVQHVKKQNNASGPEQLIPRNVYMIKDFYRYSSAKFSKKNRAEGYKVKSLPNAVMFRIIGETRNKNGLKRYKVYQIVANKKGFFRLDRKKWGYITARPSYMRPLYYSSNIHQIKVIGKGIREYKDVKLTRRVKGHKSGTILSVRSVRKLGSTYRLQLTNGNYISANKNLVRKYSSPRNIYMVKGFYRYSSVNFSKKNRIEGYNKHSRPKAIMFRIAGTVINKNGVKRYKVYQIVRNKKGLFRVDHKKWGYITARSSYVKPLYYSNTFHEVRVISDRIRVYKNLKLTKSVKSYKRGTVLKVKTVKKIGSTYRFQLTNGNYISANKNLVRKIK